LQGFCENFLKLGRAVDPLRDHLYASARIQTGTNCSENKSTSIQIANYDMENKSTPWRKAREHAEIRQSVNFAHLSRGLRPGHS